MINQNKCLRCGRFYSSAKGITTSTGKYCCKICAIYSNLERTKILTSELSRLLNVTK